MPEQIYTRSIINEIDLYESLLDQFTISSIFFGGGTPSIFSAESILKILNRIFSVCSVSDSPEITLEVNPNTADLNKFKRYKEIGINRLSIGIQSFSERKLKFLGRLACAEDNFNCIEDVLKSEINNFNLDLMYGTTDETFCEWENDLYLAAKFEPKHISAYCLTIESGTEFKKRFERGDLVLPDEKVLTGMIDFTTDYLEKKGYDQYEISNYSKSGYKCIHNQYYWRGLNYLGIGAGAHSHINSDCGPEWGKRWSNIKYPARYMSKLQNSVLPVDKTESLTKIQAFEDDLMMGIRLLDGLDLESLSSKYDIYFNLDSSDHLFSEGLVSMNENKIKLSRKGILVSDYIISSLLERAIVN